jgi:hypothetical protein
LKVNCECFDFYACILCSTEYLLLVWVDSSHADSKCDTMFDTSWDPPFKIQVFFRKSRSNSEEEDSLIRSQNNAYILTGPVL